MKKGRYRLIFSAMFLMIAVLILDNQTTIAGAEKGIYLCLHTLIPSVLPLMFFISLLIPYMSIGSGAFRFILCKLFRIPKNSEGLLLTGLLGGYPVGARNIGQAVSDGVLSQRTGNQMVIFCNACGPAFIFGVGCNLFPRTIVSWGLWTIQILSSFITARLISSKSSDNCNAGSLAVVTIPDALRRCLRSMAEICGWVILFRTFINILERWFLQYIPPIPQIICIGILELSNGCLSLPTLESEALQFVLCAAFLGFGGLCVALQSIGISPKIKGRLYITGKLLQGCVSILLAGCLHTFLFPLDFQVIIIAGVAACLLPFFVFFFRKTENKSGILNAVGV